MGRFLLLVRLAAHVSKEKSRQLQRNLYLTAKKDKQRRFHALYDCMFGLDILWVHGKKYE